jgi:hypothetical protein
MLKGRAVHHRDMLLLQEYVRVTIAGGEMIEYYYYFLSFATWTTIHGLAHHQHRWAIPVGLVLQTLWVSRWISTGQYDVIIIDLGVMFSYTSYLWRKYGKVYRGRRGCAGKQRS